LQFINIVVNLLDALKTSFSHRSMAARSLGKKDSVSEAAVAGLSLLKVWVHIQFKSHVNKNYTCSISQERKWTSGELIK
jgi:hypothetical protein